MLKKGAKVSLNQPPFARRVTLMQTLHFCHMKKEFDLVIFGPGDSSVWRTLFVGVANVMQKRELLDKKALATYSESVQNRSVRCFFIYIYTT